jgi:hypothetical protein
MHPIIAGVVSGMINNIIYYGAKRTGKKTIYNPDKLIRTMITGGILGLIIHYSGVQIPINGQEEFVKFMIANTGIVGVADQFTKMIFNFIKKFF